MEAEFISINRQGYKLFKETDFEWGLAKFVYRYWWKAPSGDTSQPFFTKKGAKEAMKNNTLEWAE